MGAIDAVIKSEIMRLAKREARKLNLPVREELKRMKAKNLELRTYIVKVDEQVQKLQAKDRLAETTSKAVSGEVTGRLSPRLIRSLRKKLGLAQNGFAKLLGVSIGSIVNWETGKMNPRPEMRAKMLSFRGVGKREVKSILANLFKSPASATPKPAAKKMAKAKSVSRRAPARKSAKKVTRRVATRK